MTNSGRRIDRRLLIQQPSIMAKCIRMKISRCGDGRVPVRMYGPHGSNGLFKPSMEGNTSNLLPEVQRNTAKSLRRLSAATVEFKDLRLRLRRRL
ncbi:unnamed protein product [Victoria cruziana]